MGLLAKIFSNTKKPEGKLGKLMAKSMNGSSHAKMADWGLQYLKGVQATAVCDFGCGGGANVGKLLKLCPRATVKGYDYSPVSVETSREYNASAIKEGRCHIIQGDVSNITLPAESLDLATAFETIYFWPGLEKCFGEVYKTLKSGGHFLIVNEADGESSSTDKWEKLIGMKAYSRAEISAALEGAGFTNVKTYHHEKKAYIAAIAEKKQEH